jgi:hypothetical protein
MVAATAPTKKVSWQRGACLHSPRLATLATCAPAACERYRLTIGVSLIRTAQNPQAPLERRGVRSGAYGCIRGGWWRSLNSIFLWVSMSVHACCTLLYMVHIPCTVGGVGSREYWTLYVFFGL